MRKIATILIICTLFLSVQGQVVINEICSRNAETITDEEGDAPDWIELYNSGDEPVSLAGWSLTDDTAKPGKWFFPEIVLPPDSFMIVFASNKNKRAVVDHWENVIKADDIWRYWIPYKEPDTLWRYPGYFNLEWQLGPGGFGRGDGDDNTVLPDSVSTVYIKRGFYVYDTSKISYVLLHVDYDDAFVAYLNGVEIGRANIGYPGKVPKWTDYAGNVHLAQMYQGGLPGEFIVDMKLFRELVREGDNILAIQGHNAWNNHGNSSLIPFLSFGIKDDSFTYSTMPDWFGGKKIYLHTNFKLSGNGEYVAMYDSSGIMIDFISFPYLAADNSYGRKNDASSEWVYFKNPTPQGTNNFSQPYYGYTKEPEFSLEAGFYDTAVYVSIVNFEPGDTIRYTLDGAFPVDSSFLYQGPIYLDTTAVLRARVFSSGLIPGKITTKTYIFNFSSTLPVISLTLDPYDLWDWNNGIYVMGPNANPYFPYKGANFWMDWEKEAHIEYFDTLQNLGFEQDIGLKIHGGFSRAYAQKSFRLLAKGKYGKSTVDYKLFKDKDITSFKRFILRNSGQDFNKTHFRDALMHKIVQEDTEIDIQDYQPALVLLNGELWGVYNIREKIGKYYLNENFGVPDDNVSILRDNYNVVAGNNYHYFALMDYIKNVPVMDSITVDSISKLLDVNSYTDYFITEMFYANPDWPNNNIKYWRVNNNTSLWRYIITDTDFGFGLSSNVQQNELYRILHGNILFTDNHIPIRRLLENNEYKRYFINRSADLFNTVLKKERMISFINLFKNRLEPEMPKQFERWGGTMAAWDIRVNGLISFAQSRVDYVYQQYIDEFSLNKLTEITLDVDDTIHGKIKINTITPDTLPWQGIYFDGNAVDITAIPNKDYVFSHWQSNEIIQGADTLKSHLRINPDTNVVFKAFFIPDVSQVEKAKIVINEINYKSADTLNAGDWVELWNIDTVSIDISGWVFKDGDDDHQFIIPAQTVLDTGDYLVLSQDTNLFNNIYPQLTNVTGPFEFGLSKTGENIRLFNNKGWLICSVNYSNEPPWPTDVSGTGRTLELKDPTGDLNDGTNWFTGCVKGSPGEPYEPCVPVGVTASGHSFATVIPNPFTEKTIIKFANLGNNKIFFRIFDRFGRIVKEKYVYLTPGNTEEIEFERGDLPPGLYFFIIYSGNREVKGKMTIIGNGQH